ncbi:MAG: bifunctional nuclease family protein [Bacteroidetes bacterium]|nr:bifunctional nuclease family protein [Bacteroidota bacterium]
MEYKRLIIRGISYSQTQTGAYALLLEDEETHVKLPVVIGNFEAQSISLGLEKDLVPPRPLTHDLFTNFMVATGFEVVSVMIYQIIDGVFYSNINVRNAISGAEMILDARTSDAVAMAVRFDAPIYTTQEVLNEAGILLEIEEKSFDQTNEQSEMEDPSLAFLNQISRWDNLTIEELNSLLEEAVKEEDFDTAMELQEEIKKRNKKID